MDHRHESNPPSPFFFYQGLFIIQEGSKEGRVNYSYVMEADTVAETVKWVKVPVN